MRSGEGYKRLVWVGRRTIATTEEKKGGVIRGDITRILNFNLESIEGSEIQKSAPASPDEL
jgi:hypothetical protein